MKSNITRTMVRTKNAINRLIHEEKGVSDVISMVVIIGIVLLIAFLFRDQLGKLFANLWNTVVAGQNGAGGAADVTVDQITIP